MFWRKKAKGLLSFGLCVYWMCNFVLQAAPHYEVTAHHTRSQGVDPDRPVKSSFNGMLKMVRVRLPKFKQRGRSIERTKLGVVNFKTDHLLDSIESLAEKYVSDRPEHISYFPERVDLITPARFLGVRFSAIAIYLGYRYEDNERPGYWSSF